MKKIQLFLNERGVAMIELAGSAMMLFILAAGLIDVSRMILTHIAFTQIAREAVRMSSGDRNLESGQFVMSVSSWDSVNHRATTNCAACAQCYAFSGSAKPATAREHHQHCLLLSLIHTMEGRWQDYYIDWTTLTLTSGKYDVDTTRAWGSAFLDDDAVDFVVQANYSGFFALFNGRQIRAQAVASVL